MSILINSLRSRLDRPISEYFPVSLRQEFTKRLTETEVLSSPPLLFVYSRGQHKESKKSFREQRHLKVATNVDERNLSGSCFAHYCQAEFSRFYLELFMRSTQSLHKTRNCTPVETRKSNGLSICFIVVIRDNCHPTGKNTESQHMIKACVLCDKAIESRSFIVMQLNKLRNERRISVHWSINRISNPSKYPVLSSKAIVPRSEDSFCSPQFKRRRSAPDPAPFDMRSFKIVQRRFTSISLLVV